MNTKINAIFWDFDGTLVDTRLKNLQVTRLILKQISGGNINQIPVLNSVNQYDSALRQTVNWRTFYRDELGLEDSDIDRAGALWTELQLKDKTPTPLFLGIREVITKFNEIPHGIISQNSRIAIQNVLEQEEILQYFNIIIGYEEVGLNLQKPDPQGMLLGLKSINPDPTEKIVFIGDHETDVLFVKNANTILGRRNQTNRIFCVGALYGYEKNLFNWKYQPDYVAHDVHELIPIIEKITGEDE